MERQAAVIVLTGPTGTGKSDLAVELQGLLPLEIVSVDSALVYRGMDIGTAKPDAALRARVPHHLIDIRDPTQSYSAGEFVRDARVLIAQIHARGRVPLLVGGTMLYLRALLDGLAALPSADPTLRARLDARAAEIGWPALHAELARVDPEAAARIHPNDVQRIQRALEVQELTGRAISVWQRESPGTRQSFAWRVFGIVPRDRQQLRERLAQRLAVMREAGFLAEVESLRARGNLTPTHPSIRAVGYRQLWSYLEGECSETEAWNAALQATTQLARRQLTWLRSEHGLEALDAWQPHMTLRLREMIDAHLVTCAAPDRARPC